jgi:hypothetical protein
LLLLLLAPSTSHATPARDVIGATHAAGEYSFTEEDYLNEGADELLRLGTRVIKVWFDLNGRSPYPFNSEWGEPAADFAELARHPYYQELFAKPFNTYILVTSRRVPSSDFLDGMTREEIEDERRMIYDLAVHLLRTYAGTGKTFVVQNWEGDHLLRRGLAPGEDPDRVRLRGMADWWNARQAGVTQARIDVKARGVTVAHAAEVNLLRDSMAGKVTATNNVVPLTRSDLYSYSSWDVEFDRAGLTRALDHLAAKAPDSSLYGSRNVYLGELGAAKDQVPEGVDRAEVIRELTDAAVGWGARWVVYWQLYCNEPRHETTGRPTNDDMRGFWLVRPDGYKPRMYADLSREMRTSLHRVWLRAADGDFVAPEDGGGGTVRVSERRPTQLSALILRDLNGGRLRNGDKIRILAHNGMYFAEERDGRVLADRRKGGEDETFVIRKVGATGRGIIGPGDRLTLEAPSGRFVEAGADGMLRVVGAGGSEGGGAGVFSMVNGD